MGYEVAFCPMTSAFFALQTDCSPAGNRSLLKHDWSYYSDNGNQNTPSTKIMFPTDAAYICRYMFKDNIAALTVKSVGHVSTCLKNET